MSVELRTPSQRFRTRLDWLDSWHSFNFGEHHEAGQGGFALLLVSNDDIVAPGRGFGTHGHRDMEIVTWVLSGALEHRDSGGHHGVLRPGIAQRMSAGTGIRHSEMNASEDEPVHFVQMWVLPDTPGIEPGYEQLDVGDRLAGGELVPVASGDRSRGGIAIRQRGATLWAGRIPHGATIGLPSAPFVHAFCAAGSGVLGRGAERIDLATGAAARCVDEQLSFEAGDDGGELLVWAMDDAPAIR